MVIRSNWSGLFYLGLEYQQCRLADRARFCVYYSGSTDHDDYCFIHFHNNHNTIAKYDNDNNDINFIYINPS